MNKLQQQDYMTELEEKIEVIGTTLDTLADILNRLKQEVDRYRAEIVHKSYRR